MMDYTSPGNQANVVYERIGNVLRDVRKFELFTFVLAKMHLLYFSWQVKAQRSSVFRKVT